MNKTKFFKDFLSVSLGFILMCFSAQAPMIVGVSVGQSGLY